MSVHPSPAGQYVHIAPSHSSIHGQSPRFASPRSVVSHARSSHSHSPSLFQPSPSQSPRPIPVPAPGTTYAFVHQTPKSSPRQSVKTNVKGLSIPNSPNVVSNYGSPRLSVVYNNATTTNSPRPSNHSNVAHSNSHSPRISVQISPSQRNSVHGSSPATVVGSPRSFVHPSTFNASSTLQNNENGWTQEDQDMTGVGSGAFIHPSPHSSLQEMSNYPGSPQTHHSHSYHSHSHHTLSQAQSPAHTHPHLTPHMTPQQYQHEMTPMNNMAHDQSYANSPRMAPSVRSHATATPRSTYSEDMNGTRNGVHIVLHPDQSHSHHGSPNRIHHEAHPSDETLAEHSPLVTISVLDPDGQSIATDSPTISVNSVPPSPSMGALPVPGIHWDGEEEEMKGHDEGGWGTEGAVGEGGGVHVDVNLNTGNQGPDNIDWDPPQKDGDAHVHIHIHSPKQEEEILKPALDPFPDTHSDIHEDPAPTNAAVDEDNDRTPTPSPRQGGQLVIHDAHMGTEYHYARYLEQQQEAISRRRAEMEARGEILPGTIVVERDAHGQGEAEQEHDPSSMQVVRREGPTEMQLQRFREHGITSPVELTRGQKANFRDAISKGIKVAYPSETGRKPPPPPPLPPLLLEAPPPLPISAPQHQQPPHPQQARSQPPTPRVRFLTHSQSTSTAMVSPRMQAAGRSPRSFSGPAGQGLFYDGLPVQHHHAGALW